MSKDWEKLFAKTGMSADDLNESSEALFFADLHHHPFKEGLLDESYRDHLISNYEKYKFSITSEDVMRLRIKERREFQNRSLGDDTQNQEQSILPALLFFTRPMTAIELSFLHQNWCSSENQLSSFKQTLELFKISFPLESIRVSPLNHGELIQVDVENEDKNLDRLFALTSFQTKLDSWVAIVRDRQSEPDLERYNRLSELVNSILRCRKRINYALFPELSIPRSVIISIASRLKSRGISLIAGVEYEKIPVPQDYPETIKGIVRNQLVYFLTVRQGDLIDQVCVIQEKVIAANEEAKDLFEEGGKVLQASDKSKYLINHGGLFMSGLICNDLLNIDYRRNLRGEIDALIVIEWNKDVDTYDALISATASDLHSYVFQVNNRLYGDTRLRAPYKESYMRDRVRVRGGELDYFVVSSIEVKKLRDFQARNVSSSEYFKPVPTGFVMSNNRRPK